MKKFDLPLILLPFALLSLLVLPRMLNYGMFIDGVHFAGVARNMAEGEGSLWSPYYTETVYPVENEHPPLGFWLQSKAFMVFGDSVRVESFWGYFIGLLLLLEIAVFWRFLCALPDKESPGPWAPMTLFCLFPLVTWGLSNNMLESTMTFFVLLSGILILAALQSGKVVGAVVTGMLSGAALFAAFLVKGPAGLFVIVLPAALALGAPKESRSRASLVLFCHLFGMAAIALLIIFPRAEAMELLREHFGRQIIPSLAGARETGSRFFVLAALAGEVAVPLALALGLWFSLKSAPRTVAWKRGALVLILALAGSVSFIVSPKQARRYLLPSLPFFAMAITCLFNGTFLFLQEKILDSSMKRRVCYSLSSALLAMALALMVSGSGKIRRDPDFYRAFIEQKVDLPERLLITVCPESLTSDWGLVANMQRWFKASLASGSPVDGGYHLTADDSCEIPEGCILIQPPVSRAYQLYECNHQSSQL